MAIKCRYCHKDIPYRSAFCPWCGGQQYKDRSKDEIQVPKPTVLKNGKYSGRINVGDDKVRVTANTEAEYYKKARAIKSGQYNAAESMTLADAITQYIKDKGSRLDVRSKDTYEYIRQHRFQSLMPVPISDITEKMLDKAIEKELCKPSRKGGTLSPKTVNDAMGLVRAVLKKYLDNPPSTTFAKEIKKLHDYPLVNEVVNAVVGTDIELPCLLALWLGLSMEEIRGLTKSKSIKDGKLSIVEKVVDSKSGKVRLQGGKAYNRVRSFYIPDYIMQLIDKVDDDIIEPRSGHAIYMRLQTELKRHNVKKCTFHDLRHLNTAVMTSNQIPSKTIQQRNGWSSDNMIKQVYDYVFDSDRTAADNIMDDYFNGLIQKK